ncbi:uncharacterized protein LOC114737453 [Neltuma alba]|uniref:uncharacterized protein LOC114737453 n=1 Tax=Neltuma alba TaxID=207710 RepID=UPI0010A51B96|nr:uncharacterized protein LOC114737453 [Prosopis alba]
MQVLSGAWISAVLFLLLGTVPLSGASRKSIGHHVKEATYLSPKFELKPGSVLNRYYYGIDFPKGHIAVKSFNGEVVDEHGNSVPLHETYLHHWQVIRYHQRKGNRNTLKEGPPREEEPLGHYILRNSGMCQDDSLIQYFAVGSETRKTKTDIPDPFGVEVGNPADIPKGHEEKWMLNVHAIDTRGVVNKLGCIECWCDLYNVTKDATGKPIEPGYKGGLLCCDDKSQCRMREGFVGRKRRLHVRYTVKWVDWSDLIVPLKIYSFDVTDTLQTSRSKSSKALATTHNCKFEYQVESCSKKQRERNACVHVKRTSFPMPKGGNIIYGLGHLHAGGIDSTVYGEDGRVLCSSKPIYGKGMGAGNEKGYIVGIKTCYPKPGSVKIMDGETITVESRYNNTREHLGVMGLFFVFVAERLPHHHFTHSSLP